MIKFEQILKYNTPKKNEWGLFSLRFPGRTGKQCLKHFKQYGPNKENSMTTEPLQHFEQQQQQQNNLIPTKLSHHFTFFFVLFL